MRLPAHPLLRLIQLHPNLPQARCTHGCVRAAVARSFSSSMLDDGSACSTPVIACSVACSGTCFRPVIGKALEAGKMLNSNDKGLKRIAGPHRKFL